MSKEKKNNIAPQLRFPEFRNSGPWDYKHGDLLFDTISNKNYNSDLPILAITQEHGAIPRNEIDYNVVVTDKSVESYKVVEIGDFIISLRSFQGGIEYSKYKGICSPAYIILRKKFDTVDDFYKYYFKTRLFISDLNKNIEGIRDGKMVSYKQFSDLLLPIPSIAEQQKIADCLSSLDDLITVENEKLDALKDHKKGLMQNLFPQEGKTVPKLRFPEFRNSGEWVEDSIGNICSPFSGGTPSTGQKEFYGGNIPFIRSAEIDKESTDLFLTDEGLKNSSAKLVKKGDVLLALYGANSGEVALAKIDGAINQAVLCLRTQESNAFIYQFLFFKKDTIIAKYIQGGQGNLSGEIVKSIKVQIPKPDEQQKIADCLSSLDDLITAENEKIETLKEHKKGLMQGLFPDVKNLE